jgi:hypothetical protein
MADLILTPEEEKAESFLDWDDASLGRAIKAGLFTLQDSADNTEKLIAYTAAMVFTTMLAKQNADILSLNIQDTTWREIPQGDFLITVHRIPKTRPN